MKDASATATTRLQQLCSVSICKTCSSALWVCYSVRLYCFHSVRLYCVTLSAFTQPEWILFCVAAMLNLVQDSALLEAAGQTQQVSPLTSIDIYWNSTDTQYVRSDEHHYITEIRFWMLMSIGTLFRLTVNRFIQPLLREHKQKEPSICHIVNSDLLF